MEQFRESFSGLNDSILANLPEWSKRIAGVMASVMRIVAATIRGGNAIFRLIRRIFEMIPAEIKILMGILGAFGAFLRAGPVGKLILLFTVLMLLVEDFFTYLDGGEALLGGLWRTLINLWETINEGGRFVEALKTAFTIAMDAAVVAIRWVLDWLANLWGLLRESNALDNFREAFSRVGEAIGAVFRAVQNIFTALFGSFSEGSGVITPFLVWLISEALPGTIGLIADIIKVVANLVSWFVQLEIVQKIIRAIIENVIDYIQTALNHIMNMFALIKALLTGDLEGVKDAIIAIFENLFGFIVRFFERILSVFRPLGAFFENIFGGIKRGVQSFINAVVGFFTRGVERWKNIIHAIIGFFQGIWNAVRNGVQAFIDAVVGFFTSKFNTIRAIVEGFRDFVSGVLGAIRGLFTSLGETIKNVFIGAWEFVKGVFSGAVDFFTGLWDKITSIFRAIGVTIGDAIGGAFKTVVNAVIGFAERTINGFIRAINGAISVINAIPGVSINPLTELGLPKLAQGGVLKKGQMGLLEGDGAEAVVPLEKNTEWVQKVAALFKREMPGGGGEKDTGPLKSIAESMSSAVKMLSQVASALSVLEKWSGGGAAAYTTSYTTNIYNFDMKSSYNIKDTSGKPQTVATAVDLTKQYQLRNLQGILNTM
jgi:phage-related protein